MILKKFLYLVCTFFLVFFLSKYILQFIKESPSSIESANIVFDLKEYHFSSIKKMEIASVYFTYRNVGKNVFKIKNIRSSCGCTVPTWSKKKLPSGGKDSILITYDSSRLGYFSKSIYVFSNSKSSPDILFINGTVLKK